MPFAGSARQEESLKPFWTIVRFTPSMADAFDTAWDTVKRWDDWQEEVSDLRPSMEQAQLPANQMPTTETETDLEPQIDMGEDACCVNAKNKWLEGLEMIEIQEPRSSLTAANSLQFLTENTPYPSMSCDEFRDKLNEWFIDPSTAYLQGKTPEKTLAMTILAEWDECIQENTFDPEGENTVDMWTSNDPFEVGWGHIAKKHPKEDEAWRTLESGESMPGPIPVAGTKGKRHYQKLGTDLFGQSGSSILTEPYSGGYGLTFGIRPPEAYVGNDMSRALINMGRIMRDNHRAMEWNPKEEYTYRVGDPRSFSSLKPGGPIIDLPPVSAQEVKDWHEITGGVGLDEDMMYGSNLRYFEHRRGLNDMMADGGWRTSRKKAEEMARLTAILAPQRIGDHMRVNNLTDQFLNIGPRGPSGKQKAGVLRTHPEAHKVAQSLLDELKAKAKAAGTGEASRLSINTTIPYAPQRITDKSGVYRYEPWSREMRDNKYHFLQGDAIPFLSNIRDKVSPENTMLGIDPPYYGEVGEHASFGPERTAALMDALRPFSDRGFPMLAFNSAQMPKKLWDKGGFESFELHPRSEKSIAGEARQVLEQIGTANIPGVTQEKVQEAQSWPASEDPVRGYYRHNAWGGW